MFDPNSQPSYTIAGSRLSRLVCIPRAVQGHCSCKSLPTPGSLNSLMSESRGLDPVPEYRGKASRYLIKTILPYRSLCQGLVTTTEQVYHGAGGHLVTSLVSELLIKQNCHALYQVEAPEPVVPEPVAKGTLLSSHPNQYCPGTSISSKAPRTF